MKKLISAILVGVMILSLTACGGDTGNGLNSDSISASNSSGSGPNSLTEAFAETPILLTSGGQSADYKMVAALLDKLKMDYWDKNLATSDDLKNAKTLIVVTGGSSKGLGAAGINKDDELARLDELLKAAEDAGLSIIVMHTGGSARRGELSDEFIAPVFEHADYAIVVASGDQDGLMSGICAEQNIPVDFIDSISDVANILPAAFK